MSPHSTWYEFCGALAFGSVIGWTGHFVLQRTKKISIGSIGSFAAAIGGGGLLRAFGSDYPSFAVYGVGLALAFFARAFLTQEAILSKIIGDAAGGSENELNAEGWDLLATLWKFQKQTCGSDAQKRWLMAIAPMATDFADFATGLGRAKKLGYIDIRSDHAIQLSTSGYQFCQQNEKRLGKTKRLFWVES